MDQEISVLDASRLSDAVLTAMIFAEVLGCTGIHVPWFIAPPGLADKICSAYIKLGL